MRAKVLPFSTSKSSVCYFRHALSLDERRAKFQPNLYNQPSDKDAERGTHMDDEDGVYEDNISTSTNTTSNEHRKLDNLEKHTTNVEEVWFAVRPFFFLFSPQTQIFRIRDATPVRLNV